MSDYKGPKISQINVADHRVGLRNLEEALEKVRSRSISDEDELKRALVEEMRNMKNYIPASAEHEYGKALLREYRRLLGEPIEEDEEAGLTVKVLGMGCPNCHRLNEEVMAALTELNLGADVEHVTDLNRIAEHGAVGTPALIINDKVRCVGRVPTRNQIRKWLEEETNRENNQ
jgi:small redox-active disulfide protein 2